MKKFFLVAFINLLAFTGVNAQSELNTTKADTTKLYIRFSNSPNIAIGQYGNSMHKDSLKKLMGKLSPATAMEHLYLATGTNKTVGSATLVSGTVTVANTAVKSTSKIILIREAVGGTGGTYLVVGAKTANTSFVINSVGTTGSLVTTDTSTVGYIIIN